MLTTEGVWGDFVRGILAPHSSIKTGPWKKSGLESISKEGADWSLYRLGVLCFASDKGFVSESGWAVSSVAEREFRMLVVSTEFRCWTQFHLTN